MATFEGTKKVNEEANAKTQERFNPMVTDDTAKNSIVGGPLSFAQGAMRGMVNTGAAVLGAADLMTGRSDSDLLRESLDAWGMRRPDNFAGRTGERFGQGVPFYGLGLVSGAAPTGFRVIATEVANDVAASGVSQFLEDLGAGTGWQVLADIGTQIANPAGRLMKNGAGAFIFHPSRTTRTNKQVKALADKLGVSEKAILRAANFHRANDLNIKPGTDEVSDGLVLQRLREAVADNPDPNVRPLTVQAASRGGDSNLAGAPPSLAARSKAWNRADTEFRNRAGGRVEALLIDIENQYDSMLPNGTWGQAEGAFNRSLDQSLDAVSDAWDAVPIEKMPMVETARLKESVREVMRRIGEDFPEQYPDEVRKILDLPDSIPASRLQKLRSGILRSHRINSRGTAESVNLTKAQHMGPILDSLQKEMDGLFKTAGGSELRAALKATRKHYEDFSGSSVALRAFQDLSEGRRAVSKIMNAKDPVAEARRVIRILDQTPEGADPFRRAVLDQLADDTLGERSVGPMLRQINRKSEFYKTVLGDDGYGQLKTVLKRLRTATTTTDGSAAAFSSTGSGMNKIGGLLTGMSNAMGGNSSTNAVSAAVAWAGNKIKNAGLDAAIEREFLLDPESAIIILTAPDKSTIGVWTATFDMLMARAATRRALVEYGEIAGRSLVQNQRPNMTGASVDTPLPTGR